MVAPLAIAAGASAVGSLAGAWGASKRRRAARKAQQAAIDTLKQQMLLDPQKALQFLELSKTSAYEDLPPEMRAAAEQATQQLLSRGAGSGLDIQSRQALQEASRGAGQKARAARQAVLSEYAQRGGATGPAALAAELMGTQQSYEDLASAQGQASAAAEQRRLEANVLASRAAQQQQQIDQSKAQAIDALRQFNVGARQGLLSGQSSALGSLAGAHTGMANLNQQQAPQVQQTWNTIGRSAGSLGSGIASGWGGAAAGGGSPYPYEQYGGLPSTGVGATAYPYPTPPEDDNQRGW